ncbi:IclR family transcriptional regulator [Psychrobacillus soli]|uniref:IclR family transcriptional regulator n=1 Tax=Psychrobacillus soli TaxID=1543965 RepID=A0A544SRI1_9BACI|nr:IclR family transcriptional regulator [Psychrobacillus soli]TQR07789.1 IclR family transcriptional regulator [Psychrobacillus soli]
MKNKTVVRSMDILNLFIEHAELTFQEIIELSHIPKTSVYRMLISLEEMGFLEKGDDSKYRLGLLFLTYGNLVSTRLDLRQIAYPIMQSLHKELKEAINLIIRQGEEAMYIEKIDHYQKVRLYTAIGRKSPLYAGACSRVLLSFLQEDEIESYVENIQLESFAIGTITEKGKLLESIKNARENGYTISHSELENHTSAIAAPIFNCKGEVVAGISIAGIEVNYQDENVARFAEKAIYAANEISRKLGYQITSAD